MVKWMYPSESLDLLRKINGDKIVRMVRMLRGDVSRYFEYRPNIQERALFNFSGWELFIQFERLGYLVFYENEKEASIILWQVKELPIARKFPDVDYNFINGEVLIDCTDSRYSEKYLADFLGKKVVKLDIVNLAIDRKNARPFRNERGLCFTSEDGVELILETGLARKKIPGGFNIVKREQLDPEIEEDLIYQRIES